MLGKSKIISWNAMSMPYCIVFIIIIITVKYSSAGAAGAFLTYFQAPWSSFNISRVPRVAGSHFFPPPTVDNKINPQWLSLISFPNFIYYDYLPIALTSGR